jgi:hypothetical protein
MSAELLLASWQAVIEANWLTLGRIDADLTDAERRLAAFKADERRRQDRIHRELDEMRRRIAALEARKFGEVPPKLIEGES